MTEVPEHGPRRNRLVSAAAIVVIIAGLKAAGPIIVPVLLAVFLTVLAAPTVLWLQRRRVPAAVGVIAVMLALVSVIAVFAVLLTTAFGGFNEALPGYQSALSGLFTRAFVVLADYGLEVAPPTTLESLNPSTVVSTMTSLLAAIVAALSRLALVLIIVVFMVLEVAGFPAKLRAALEDPSADLGRWGSAIIEVQRYLLIKTGICIATGALIGLWLWVIGVDFPILWGLVAFMLNYIPSIGSVIAAVPALLVALVQPDVGPGVFVLALLGYIVVNVALGNLLEPQLMGRRFGLSPLIVLLSLVFWGWVWGPVGMLLSVPLTMITRIVLEQQESTRWVAVLLGPPRESAARVKAKSG